MSVNHFEDQWVINVKRTRLGNEIKRGFSFSGCNGTEYDLRASLVSMGFKLFYCKAHFYWGVVNPQTRQIFIYTEGDTDLITCSSNKSLVEELERYVEFFSTYDKRLMEEARENLEQFKEELKA